MTYDITRRHALKLFVGGAAAATIPLPRGFSQRVAAQELAYKGDIEFWDWEFAARQFEADAIIADWKTRYPDINLSYQVLPYSDAQTRLITAATAGEGPPFANVHFNWRVDLQRAGVLVPYPADLLDFDNLISTPFNRDASGNVYTCTFSYYTDQVYYNQTALDEQGITVDQIPKTWADYLPFVAQLTKRDGDRIQQAGWAFNHYYSKEWLWATMIYQQGGYLYSEDGTQALWNSDAAVTALQLIQDVYHVHKADDPDSLSMFDAFGGGQAATYISQGYTGSGWTQEEYPDLVWGTATTPTFTGSPEPSWGLTSPEEGFCVFTTASPEQQAVAFQFIKELVGTDDQLVKWSIIANGPPDKQSLAADPRIVAAEKGRSISTQAETLPWRINYGERPLEAEAIWGTMFDEVVLNKADVKATADKATEDMNAALAASGKQRLFTERLYTPPSSTATPTT